VTTSSVDWCPAERSRQNLIHADQVQQFDSISHPRGVRVHEIDRATSAAGEYAKERGAWLARCAYLLTLDHERALDLVQDTLLQAWRARDLVDEAHDRDRYVLRIMLNIYRGEARKKRLELTDFDPHSLVWPHDLASRLEDADLVARAMSELSHRQRAVIVLRYWVDLDDTEIAQVLRCRRSTVRSIAARSLTRIRRNLEPRP